MGPVYDAEFRSHLIAVLKEMVENSIKWSQSTRVQLRGGNEEIAIDSDGSVFDPLTQFPKLVVSGGGKRDLDSFLAAYGAAGINVVDVSWHLENGTQSLVIRLKSSISELRGRFFCTLLLSREDARDYALKIEPLVDLSSCREVWLDATYHYMSGSDGMLLSMLCSKVPKTVERIYIRGLDARYVKEYGDHFKFDTRVTFV